MDYQTEVELVIRSLSRPKAAALAVVCAMMWLKRFHSPIWEVAELAQVTGFSADAIGDAKPILLSLKLVTGAGAAGRYGLVLNDRAVKQLGLWDLAPVGEVVDAVTAGLRLVGESELSTGVDEELERDTAFSGLDQAKSGLTAHSSSSSCFPSSAFESETTTTTPGATPQKPVSAVLPTRYEQAAEVLEVELGLSRAFARIVASEAAEQDWGGAWLEFQALRWLVYCCSERGRTINSIPGFVGARLRNGECAPGYTRADSWDMRARLQKLFDEVTREEAEREERRGG